MKWVIKETRIDVLAELLRLEIKKSIMIYSYGGKVDLNYVFTTDIDGQQFYRVY